MHVYRDNNHDALQPLYIVFFHSPPDDVAAETNNLENLLPSYQNEIKVLTMINFPYLFAYASKTRLIRTLNPYDSGNFYEKGGLTFYMSSTVYNGYHYNEFSFLFDYL